jgi:hypothetical protein
MMLNSRFSECWTFFSLAAAVICCAVPLGAQTKFTSFDAPDAGKGIGKGTFPVCINDDGGIAGQYIDSNNQSHGFVRSRFGVITEFDPPLTVNTYVSATNQLGQIVGSGTYVQNSSEVGFQRNQNGQFLGLSPPGAVDTYPSAINDPGEVVGYFSDSAGVVHGFLRDLSGAYTVFDEPEASSENSQGTFVNGMNYNGAVVGFYNDAVSGQIHGFVRDQFGNFSSFDPSGSVATMPTAINLSGQVTGYYRDSAERNHAFFRDASGNITSFDVSGSIGTFGNSINDAGVIVGEWNSLSGYLGFERSASGNIISFSASHAGNTDAVSIDRASFITGWYVDSNNVTHGFAK